MLLLTHIAQHHGVSRRISHDRDPLFMSRMFRTICDRLGILQSPATAYHPQTSGLVERYVRELVRALRVTLESANEDWADILPLISMSLNSAPHTVTGESPFYVEHGRHNGTYYDLTLPLVQAGMQPMELRKALQSSVKDSLEHARWVRALAINARRDLKTTFKAGDKVLVSQVALLEPEERDRQFPKLRHKRTGPYEIKRMKSRNVAELKLPSSLRCHPTVNVCHLLHYEDGSRLRGDTVAEPPIFKSSQGDFYQVERIINHRKRRGQTQFLVKWSGYDPSHNSYVLASDFASDRHIKAYCQQKGISVPTDAPSASR